MIISILIREREKQESESWRRRYDDKSRGQRERKTDLKWDTDAVTLKGLKSKNVGASRTWKRQGTHFPLHPPEGTSSADTFILAPKVPIFRLLTSRAIR